MARSLLGKSVGRILRRSQYLQGLSWRLEWGLMAMFWGLCGRLPLNVARAVGRSVLGTVGPWLAKHQTVVANLQPIQVTTGTANRQPIQVTKEPSPAHCTEGANRQLLSPPETASPIQTLAREHWRQFGQVLAEYPHLSTLVSQASVVIDAATQSLIAQHQPIVFVGAHLGNWELPPLMAQRLGIELCAIYAPLQNPFTDHLLMTQRQRGIGFLAEGSSRSATTFLPKARGLRGMLQAVKQGKSLGLLVDQRPDDGEAVSFFGRETPTLVTPAWLAVKWGLPIVPLRCYRHQDHSLTVELHAPLTPSSAGDAETAIRAMTRKINEIFEVWIAERPTQWLCVKRRWPRQ